MSIYKVHQTQERALEEGEDVFCPLLVALIPTFALSAFGAKIPDVGHQKLQDPVLETTPVSPIGSIFDQEHRE